MSQLDISAIAERWWNTVCLKVQRAIVYADGPATEFLHWQGGLSSLISRGAVNVKELSSSTKGLNNEKKAVFLVSFPLHEESLSILRDVITHSSFQVCTVITSASPGVHLQAKYGSSPESQDEAQVFYTLEDTILEWMGNMNFTAEVLHVPIFAVPITSDLFIMPSFTTMFPLLPWEIHSLTKSLEFEGKRKNYKAEISFSSLHLALQTKVKHFVCCLNSLFEELDVHEEIFSIGGLSRIIGSDLENLPNSRNRRKVARQKAMLLLVDRTVDLAGPLSQEMTTMIDRIVRVLPHHYHQTMDVEVDMTSFCSAYKGDYVAKGCLSQKNDKKSSIVMNHMINKKQRDFLVEVNRLLVDTASKGGIKMDVSMKSGRLTADLLEQRVAYLRQNPKVAEENIGFIQNVLAAVQTLKHPGNTKLDSLQSSEKLLVQNMDVSEEGPSRNMVHLINQRKQSSMTLTELIGLLGFLFTLNGENALGTKDDEAKVQTALVEAIFQDMYDGLPQFLRELIGETRNETLVLEKIKFLFHSLKSLGNIRQDFKKYKQVFFTGGVSEPAHYVPFLKQLMDDLFNPLGTDLIDIEYHSGGFRDMLKSGFSLFMNVSKPQPRNYPLIVIIVVGGITGNEVRLIKETLSHHHVDAQVLIGSTMLSTPEVILNKIFVKNRFK